MNQTDVNWIKRASNISAMQVGDEISKPALMKKVTGDKERVGTRGSLGASNNNMRLKNYIDDKWN